MKSTFPRLTWLSAALGALLVGAFSALAQPTTNVTINPNSPWQGYLNTYNSSDVYQTANSGGENPINVRASFVPAPPTRLLLQINTNTYDATSPGAFDNGTVNTFNMPNGTPILTEQNLAYVDVGTNFDGKYVNFSGTCESNTIPAGWVVNAFVEEWLPGYDGNLPVQTNLLVGGQPFSITTPNAVYSGDIIQYGFYISGPNTAPGSANAKQAASLFVNTNNSAPTVNVTVNPTADWIGYLSYYNYTSDAYEGSFSDGLADLPSVFLPNQTNATSLTLGINTNTWDPTATNAYDNNHANTYDNANGTPATTLELDTYVDVGTAFAGDQVIFSGTVLANTIPSGWTANAFIKEYTAGYAVEVAAPITPLVSGQPFALSHTIAAGDIAQYGFQVLGPNTAPNSAAASDLVTIQVGNGAASPITLKATVSGSNVQLSFQTVNLTSYTIQYTTTLTPASWQTLTTFTGDGAVDTKTDTLIGNTTRFYRVQAN